jgi:plastocyanin
VIAPTAASALSSEASPSDRDEGPPPSVERPRRGAASRGGRLVGVIGGLACAAALVAACSNAPPAGQSAAGSSSPSSPVASAPTAPGAAATSTHAQAVAVQMTEYHLALPRTTLAAGTYTFTAVNAGRAVHALAINGPGVKDQHTGAVVPGATAPLTVTLTPGTYDMYCPVGNHKAMGMDVALTVSGPGASPAPGSTGGGSGGY